MNELLDVFNAIPRVPDYALDTRWRRAQTRDFKRIPPSQYIDGWMERARRFGENWHRLAEEWDGRSGHGDVDDDVYAAYHLWQGPVLTRAIVEARILAGQSDDAIAVASGLSACVVAAYEALFFRVRDRLDASLYIHLLAINPRAPRRLTPGDVVELLKLFAYRHGPAVVEACETYFLGRWRIPNELASADRDKLRRLLLALVVRALVLSETRPETSGRRVERLRKLARRVGWYLVQRERAEAWRARGLSRVATPTPPRITPAVLRALLGGPPRPLPPIALGATVPGPRLDRHAVCRAPSPRVGRRAGRARGRCVVHWRLQKGVNDRWPRYATSAAAPSTSSFRPTSGGGARSSWRRRVAGPAARRRADVSSPTAPGGPRPVPYGVGPRPRGRRRPRHGRRPAMACRALLAPALLEASILAGQDDAGAAATYGASAGMVGLYCDLYYDVRDWLDARLFVFGRLLPPPPAWPIAAADQPALLRRLAYEIGSAVIAPCVRYFAGLEVPSDLANADPAELRELQELMGIHAAVQAMTLPAGKHRRAEVMIELLAEFGAVVDARAATAAWATERPREVGEVDGDVARPQRTTAELLQVLVEQRPMAA